MLGHEPGEELRILLPPGRSPRPVVGEEILKEAHEVEGDRPRSAGQVRDCKPVQHESPWRPCALLGG